MIGVACQDLAIDRFGPRQIAVLMITQSARAKQIGNIVHKGIIDEVNDLTIPVARG